MNKPLILFGVIFVVSMASATVLALYDHPWIALCCLLAGCGGGFTYKGKA